MKCYIESSLLNRSIGIIMHRCYYGKLKSQLSGNFYKFVQTINNYLPWIVVISVGHVRIPETFLVPFHLYSSNGTFSFRPCFNQVNRSFYRCLLNKEETLSFIRRYSLSRLRCEMQSHTALLTNELKQDF